MKLIYSIAIFGVLFLVLLSSGCTSTSPSVQEPNPVPTTALVVIPSPTPTAVPYPNALVLDQYAHFGSGNEQGTATVYRYDI
ncbi:MAG: hypothetical protein Q8R70_04715, partial [Methanoregula sp.]|nr:hypothetical protein [Methanoregula sp.]